MFRLGLCLESGVWSLAYSVGVEEAGSQGIKRIIE